jgi:hypothetical protein
VSPTPDDWGEAYAQQALADFDAWNELQGNPAIPSCQKGNVAFVSRFIFGPP